MCLKGCPYGAIVADDKGADYPTIKRSLCQKCPDYACRKACPAGALVVYGDFLEPLEVIKRVEKDEVFFQRGGGGLTVSGGEPLNQPDFLLDLLSLAHKRRLKTALETSGFGSYEVLKAAARVVENILYDVKVISRAKHLAGTGQDNELILDNLKRLTADFPKLSILVRTPVVPGFNDTSKDAQELGQFLRALPNVTFEALPYHRFGEGKYGFLGRTYPLAGLTLDPKALEDFNRLTLAARNL
jgi:pyruvate formate lyase activating enzyme